MELVIMAAGMGSRFGGLKQIEPMGPNGEFLIDYSVYDAIRCGFDKIIFIIKKENYDIFQETIGKRVENKIKVEYVFQEFTDVPEGLSIPQDRIKPLGTAHAIYCVRNVVKGNFAVINADDFYGYNALKQASDFLQKIEDKTQMGMVGYETGNTLTKNGSVKRGICQISNNYLTSLIESSIKEEDNTLIATPLNGDTPFKVTKDTIVSMNMFLFTPYIFEILTNDIVDFFKNTKDLIKDEYLIPDVVFKNIKNNKITVKVLKTSSKWYGVTYKEDTDEVKESLRKLVENGEYPQKLWK